MFKRLRRRTPTLLQSKAKTAIYILICIVIVLSCTIIPFNLWKNSDIESRGITSVRGNSMTPTIKNNDIMFVQPTKFERGEIVVARCPDSKNYAAATNVALLKRIVGLPGETIEITKEGVLIDGQLLQEDYTENIELTLQDSNEINEIILSDNEYFLLGDNRANSFDSRHVGAIHASKFLYGLTNDPNDYTISLYVLFGLVLFIDILIILVLPILIFIIFTHAPKEIRLDKNSRYDHPIVQSKSNQKLLEPESNKQLSNFKAKHKKQNKYHSSKVRMTSKAKLKQSRKKRKK